MIGGIPPYSGITERRHMTTERISGQVSQAVPDISAQLSGSEAKADVSENSNDLMALRNSLEMKRQLLSLLYKGGYVKDVDTIKTDVERAIADLDEIIKAFPDEQYSLNINKL